jgi:DNA-binding NarL/FixJ family response regulator
VYLTDRDKQILQCLATGYSGKEVAEQLGMPYGTYQYRLRTIYMTLKVHNLPEAIAAAMREDWIK